MQLISRAPRVRAFGASIAALTVAFFVGISVSAEPLQAVASSSPNDTVWVPRITKGAHGTLMRVKRDSPEARIFFATQTPRSVSPTVQYNDATAVQKRACRSVALHNMKGAYSVAGGQKLVRCGPAKVAKTTFCAASMPCAQSAPCPMAMFCAV